jgi:hypothetical protein
MATADWPTNSNNAATCYDSNTNNITRTNFDSIASNVSTTYKELDTAYSEPSRTIYDSLINSDTSSNDNMYSRLEPFPNNEEYLEVIATNDEYLQPHDELQPIATNSLHIAPNMQRLVASLSVDLQQSALPLHANTQRPALPLPDITQRPALPLPDITQRPALPLPDITQRPALSMSANARLSASSQRSDTRQPTLPRHANSHHQSALDNSYQEAGAASHNCLTDWRRGKR